MGKLKSFFKTAYDKQIDGNGLAVFRIVYSVILLCEIAQMFYFRHLIFDKIPYVETAEIDFGIPIGIWFVSVFFLLLGLNTRLATIINYLMSLILIGSISSYEYHVFYAYMGVNFILIFMPVSQRLSIDRLIEKLKYSTTNYIYEPTKNVSQLHYFYLVFLGVGIVYFDSIFLKTTEYSWYSGLGVWMPSSFPMMVHMNLTPILNIKPLMLFLGYLTLVFEAAFLFVFFRKKFRLLVFVIGVGLHIGILITFPIPWFALTVISLYLLLIPVSFFQKLRFKSSPSLKYYYDKKDITSLKTKIFFEHFDLFSKIEFIEVNSAQLPENIDSSNKLICTNLKGEKFAETAAFVQIFRRIPLFFPLYLFHFIPGVKALYSATINKIYNTECVECKAEISTSGSKKTSLNFFYYFFIFAVIAQCLIIYKSSVVYKIRQVTGITNTSIDKSFVKAISSGQKATKNFLGLTSHSVFLDRVHYQGYNHIIAITYLDSNNHETWLPVIDKNGQPSYYNYGTNWRKISFSTNSRNIDQDQLAKGVRDFTAFWAYRNNIALDSAKFLIKVKKIDSPNGWEKDYLNKQIAKPWQDGGNVYWKDQIFYSDIKDIESI